VRSSSGSSEDRGPQGSVVWEAGGGRSRAPRRSVRESAAAAIGVSKNTNPPLRPDGEQGGRLPRKKRTTTPWPRWGCRGLHRHSGAFSIGGSRPYGGSGIPAPYGILPSPVRPGPDLAGRQPDRREDWRCPGRERRAMEPRPLDPQPSRTAAPDRFRHR
jgi:hypothetical protein